MMSTARLTPRALNTTLIPFVSLLFLSGIPRVFPPLIVEVWGLIFNSTMPAYLLTISSVFGWLSVVAGLIKFWFSDDIAATLEVGRRVKTFGAEDVGIVTVYLGIGIIVVVLLGIEVTLRTLIQSSMMLLLSMFFVALPWYLTTFLETPKETEDIGVKSMVFLTTVLLAGIGTGIALVLMRVAEMSFT